MHTVDGPVLTRVMAALEKKTQLQAEHFRKTSPHGSGFKIFI